MPWTSVFPIIVWAVVFIPLAVVLWLVQFNSKLTALLYIAAYAAASFFFVMTVNWSLVWYYMRFLPALFVLLLIIRQMYISDGKPFFPPKGRAGLIPFVVSLLLIAPLVYVDSLVLRSYEHESFYEKDAILVYFPLREGMYVVTNGGNSLNGLGMNNHVNSIFGPPSGTMPNQGYAVDLMKMTIRGTVSEGVLNRDYRKYLGYNEPVYSPCVGEVVKVVDGIPDVPVLSQGDPMGNYVVLKCFEWYVTLANFRAGNFFVKEGDQVWLGQVIGRIGNSGTPSIPHLHIQVNLEGYDENAPAVPILFELRFSGRNAIFIPQF